MDQTIVLFDGVCAFCNFWVNFAISNDKNKRLKFATLQSEKGLSILNNYRINSNEINSVICLSNNVLFTQAEAVIQISKQLSGLGKMGMVLKIFPKRLRNNLYNLIAKNRYRLFGKYDQCIIPTKEKLQWFL
jgi:predicted DCC family thiol-disulfide oxidoreductase YuxK